MTILVATREGVWADRRLSNGYGSVFTPARKVVRGDGLVAAFCGSSASCARAMAAVRGGETDLDVLAALSDGVAVNRRGVWELDGTATKVRAPFAVNGSGYAEAQAFLCGARGHSRALVRKALQYVAKVRSDCGDGIDEALYAKK